MSKEDHIINNIDRELLIEKVKSLNLNLNKNKMISLTYEDLWYNISDYRWVVITWNKLIINYDTKYERAYTI